VPLVIRNPETVKFLKETMEGRGPKEPIWTAGSNEAGDALKSAMKEVGGPDDVKLKDLRTIKATQRAREVVERFPGPPPPLSGDKKKDVKLITRAIIKMSAQVAEVLNNTATQARDNYIHPEVFRSWQGKLLSRKALPKKRSK